MAFAQNPSEIAQLWERFAHIGALAPVWWTLACAACSMSGRTGDYGGQPDVYTHD